MNSGRTSGRPESTVIQTSGPGGDGSSVTNQNTSAMIDATLDDQTRGDHFLDRITSTVRESLGVHTSFIASSLAAPAGRSRLLACSARGHCDNPIDFDATGPDPVPSLRASNVIIRDLDPSRQGDRWLIDIGLSSIATTRVPIRRRQDIAQLGVADAEDLHLSDEELTALRLVALRVAGELDDLQIDAELASSLDAFHDIRFRITADGTIVRAWSSDSLPTVGGVDSLVSTKISDHFPPALADQILSRIATTIESGEVTRIEYDRHLEDQRFCYEGRAARLADAEVIVVVRDITEIKSLREQLQHARTLESVRRLAGGVAHDFNNALHVIRGSVSALQRDRPQPIENLDHRLAAIVRAVDRTTALVDRLNLIGRSPANQPTRVSVDQFIADLEPDLRKLLGPEITLRLELEAANCAVLIDRGRFEDVVLNLVRNALDAVELRGSIAINTQSVADESVSIRVTDCGIGMDEETSRHIFEPFFSTKSPGVGVGLGLALVSATITDAGGTISVRSIPTEGTTVSVQLPCRHGELAGGSPIVAAQQDPLP